MSRRLAGLAVVIVSTLAPRLSPADELEPLRVGVGLVGVAGANFIDAPESQSITIDGSTATPVSVPEYPGFSGPTYGLGPVVDLRLFEYAGVEIDLLRTRDRGRAELRMVRLGAERSFTLEIAHDAFHLLVLFKSVLPTGVVRPMLLVGPELVLPDEPSAGVVDGESLLEPAISASQGAYTMLTWGLGGEVDLPLSEVDLRVSASLRGSVTPGVGGARSARATYLGADVHRLEQIIYRTRWRYQAVGTVMVGLYF
ncbi:MAG: hypothetical protein JRI23_01665 [Deltaproteobacteria bacterium]|jgi:hypothetical protein|nr:hypothetical protein [Deltaproteobacteria bacterium]MBW2530174.1 hypothetical protein [Deltaproteobacteria bacterium]